MFRDTKKRTLARVVTMVLAMAVVTSSATDAKATSEGGWGYGGGGGSMVSLELVIGLLLYEASVIGLVIHDLGDMDVESPRSTKNLVGDVVLSIPHWLLCFGDVFASSESYSEEGGVQRSGNGGALLGRAYFCGTAGILSYHALVESRRQKPPSSNAEPSDSAAEPAKSLSWGPMLLGKDATLGLGLVGRF